MVKIFLSTLLLLVSSVSMANPVGEFKPFVLYQGANVEHSYLALVEKGTRRFEAVTQIPVESKVLDRDSGRYIEELRVAASAGYSPIIVQDANSLQGLDIVASDFPSTKFISIDVAYSIPNILGLTFDQAEGAFIAGYLAGKKTKTNRVGFVGGMDIGVVNDFKCGFESGLLESNPEAEFYYDYIGIGAQVWENLPKARELTQKMVENNVDVVFPAAGQASEAVIEVMGENGGQSFGVDYDYAPRYPQSVLMSVEKRLDVAIFASLMQIKQGVWNSNIKRFGVKQDVIRAVVNEENDALTQSDLDTLEELQIELKSNNSWIQGKIRLACN